MDQESLPPPGTTPTSHKRRRNATIVSLVSTLLLFVGIMIYLERALPDSPVLPLATWTIGLAAIWLLGGLFSLQKGSSVLRMLCIRSAVVLPIGAVSGVAVFTGDPYNRMQVQALNVFKGSIPDYMSSFNQLAEAPKERQVHIRPKVLVILVDEAGSDPIPRVEGSLFYKLPSEIRARRPDEVQTVVVLTRTRHEAGTYLRSAGGGPGAGGYTAYRIRVTLGILDVTHRIKAANVATFLGGEPSESITADRPGPRQSVGGADPVDEIITYIRGHVAVSAD